MIKGKLRSIWKGFWTHWERSMMVVEKNFSKWKFLASNFTVRYNHIQVISLLSTILTSTFYIGHTVYVYSLCRPYNGLYLFQVEATFEIPVVPVLFRKKLPKFMYDVAKMKVRGWFQAVVLADCWELTCFSCFRAYYLDISIPYSVMWTVSRQTKKHLCYRTHLWTCIKFSCLIQLCFFIFTSLHCVFLFPPRYLEFTVFDSNVY
jgi:hypothetical protein